MLRTIIVRTVDWCARHARLAIAAAVLASVAGAVYTVRNFAITTDVTQLISTENSHARKNQKAYEADFPPHKVLAVVEAPTPELAQQATDRLAKALPARSNALASVVRPDGGAFFQRNALLFLPLQDVARITGALTRAKPILGMLAADPSLRGIANALSAVAAGVQGKQIKLDDLTRPLTLAADTLRNVLAGRPASFSWRVLLQGRPATPAELRGFIAIDPILNYAALEPGKAATDAVRQVAANQKLASDFDARVKLTGEVPIDDEEFATVQRSAPVEIMVAIGAILIVLWLALRSVRIVAVVVFALAIGFAITAALGLLTVGSLNLISVAFAVLFLGIGVDFGLQFSVRYRAERHDLHELPAALRAAATKAGVPLALAAAATAAAFFSFLPTAFRGVSELGQIAGSGMLVAFITTITVVPAGLMLAKPPPEPHQMGFAVLAPLDRFMMRHRIPIVAATIGIVALASPLLLRLEFDFDPVHLQNPKVEAVATFLELRGDPNVGANAINVLAPSLADADRTAARLAQLPQVDRAVTLDNFVPDAQEHKLALIRSAADALQSTIDVTVGRAAPTDAQTVRALQAAAAALSQAAGEDSGRGAAAARTLAALLTDLSGAAPKVRVAAENAFAAPLSFDLQELKLMLRPQKITPQDLPPDVARSWVAPNGTARIELLPKGDPNDASTLRNFASAVLAAEPSATGAPVLLQQAANVVVRAFIEAGLLALVSIAALLWIALRRVGDVLLTLVPLVLAATVTLEISVLIGLQLNFANIVALPLLLGVGVAFKIYYIMAWRTGKTDLLQSTLTRAVIFSAMTTATAFGSLWLSDEPGISSMGKLMVLALACTLAAAVLFQPILMGPPRRSRGDTPAAAKSAAEG
ncbi:MAG TPA: MMPL family transporter [Xanthobacteraceae bacterium]